MKAKKTSGADLENKRTTFFLMGFAVVLSSFFVLMEWRSSNTDDSNWDLLNPVFIENEFSENTEISGNSKEQNLEAPPKTETVYDDYQVVDEAIQEELLEKLPVRIHVDSTQTIPKMENDLPLLSKTNQDTGSDVFASAEVMPQFPGGNTELIRYIYANIKYPTAALKQRIQGRVWCSFIVNQDGSIADVRLENGVYIFLDEEAVRVLKTMPAWKPGLNAGKEIRVKVYLPIVFKL
jgi:protein TonB